ncbi:CENP-meta [Haematobia irritans]|uniref:CENP-meta n=1 Tax=Haematobia irritans TaxID=7368 RepID=UPI003F4FF67A
MSGKNSIQVAIKVRPLLKKEKDQQSLWRVINNSIQQSDSQTDPYYFDHIFDQNATNQQIFDKMAKHIVHSAIQGFNGTIFAYGQTSSGKTYTMMGDEDNPGVMVLAAKHIFREIELATDRQFLIRVGYIEIYNEKIYDLLNKKNQDLKIHETGSGIITVNCEECFITTEEELLQYLTQGSKERTVGETNMNERSSRSHAIFRIIVESRKIDRGEDDSIIQSVLNLVDLAGSERADQTGARGTRLKEGGHINKSLLFLSNVIKRLSENEDDKFISFRDSKLTRILQASLGGNALTAIICTIKPTSIEETQSTLSFAMRAKSIKNKPQVNETVSDATMMKRLEREVKILRTRLEEEQRKNESQLKVRQLEQRIRDEDLKIISCVSLHSNRNREKRRRTWCPSTNLDTSTTNLPSALPIPTFANAPVSSAGNLPPSRLQPPKTTYYHTPLITMRPTEPPSAPKSALSEPISEIDEEFAPAETVNFDRLSPLLTPKTNMIPRCSVTPRIMSNPKLAMEKLENDFMELQSFTNLEKQLEVQHEPDLSLKQTVDLLMDRISILENERIEYIELKDEMAINREQLSEFETRCDALQIQVSKLTAANKIANEKIAKYELELAELKKTNEKLEMENRDAVNIEFEFDRHKNKSKLRENELIEALKDKEQEIIKLEKSLKAITNEKFANSKEGLLQLSLTESSIDENGKVCVKCEDLQRLLSENEKVTHEFDKLTLEYEQLRLDFKEIEKENEQSKLKVSELEELQKTDRANCDQLQEELQALREKLLVIQSEYQQVNLENTAKTEECSLLNKEIEEARQEMLVLQEKYNKLELSWQEQQQILKDIESQYTDIENKYKHLQSEYEQLESSKGQSMTDCERLQKENVELQTEIVELKHKVQEVHQQLLENAEKSATNESITPRENGLPAADTSTIHKENDELKQKLLEIQTQFDDLQREYDDLSNQLIDNLQESDTLKEQNIKLKEKLHELEQNKLEVSKAEAELSELKSHLEKVMASERKSLLNTPSPGRNSSMLSSGVCIEEEYGLDESPCMGDGDLLKKFHSLSESLTHIELEHQNGKRKVFKTPNTSSQVPNYKLCLRNISGVSRIQKDLAEEMENIHLQGSFKQHSFHIVELSQENGTGGETNGNGNGDIQCPDIDTNGCEICSDIISKFKEQISHLRLANEEERKSNKSLLENTERTLSEMREQINQLSAELLEKSIFVENCACKSYQKQIETLEKEKANITLVFEELQEKVNNCTIDGSLIMDYTLNSSQQPRVEANDTKPDLEVIKAKEREMQETIDSQTRMLEDLTQRNLDMESDLKSAQGQLESQEKEYKEKCHQLQLEILQKLEMSANEHRDNMKKYNKEWEDRKDTYEATIKEFEEQIIVLKAQNEDLTKKSQEMQEQNDRQALQSQKSDEEYSEKLKLQLEALQVQNKELQEALENGENTAKQLENLQEQYMQLQTQLEANNKAQECLNQLQGEYQQLQSQLEECLQNLKNSEESSENIKKELEISVKAMQNIQTENEQLKQKLPKDDEISNKAERSPGSQKQLDQVKELLRKTLHDLQEEKENSNNVSKELESLKTHQSTFESDIKELLDKSNSQKEELLKEIHMLKEKEDQLSQEKLEIDRNLLELREDFKQLNERYNIIIQDKQSIFEENEDLLKKISILENNQSSQIELQERAKLLEEEKNLIEEKTKYLEDQLANFESIVEEKNSLEVRLSALDEMQQLNKDLEDRLKAVEKSFEEKSNELELVHAQNEADKTTTNDLQQKIHKLEEQLQQERLTLVEKLQELDLITEAKNSLKQELDASEEKSTSLANELQKLQSQLDDGKEKEISLLKENEQLHQSLKTLTNSSSNLELEKCQLAEELQHCNAELQKLKNEHSVLENQLALLSVERKSLSDQCSLHAEEISTLKDQLKCLKEKEKTEEMLEQMIREKSELSQNLRLTNEKFEAKKKEYDTLNEANEKLKFDLVNLQCSLVTVNSEKDKLNAQLERYQSLAEEKAELETTLVKLKHNQAIALANLNQEISSLKGQLEGLQEKEKLLEQLIKEKSEISQNLCIANANLETKTKEYESIREENETVKHNSELLKCSLVNANREKEKLEVELERYEQLREEKTQMEATLSDLKHKQAIALANLKQENDQLKQSVQKYEQENSLHKQNEITLALKEEKLSQELHELKGKLQTYENLMKEQEETECSLQSAMKTNAQLSSEIETLKSSLSSNANNYKEVCEKQNDKIKELESQLLQSKELEHKLLAKIQHLENELEGQQKSLQKHIQDLKSSLSELQLKCDNLQASNDQLECLNQQLQQQLQESKQKQQESETIRGELLALRSEYAEVKKKMEDTIEEAGRCSRAMGKDLENHKKLLEQNLESYNALRTEMKTKQQSYEEEKQQLIHTIETLQSTKTLLEEKMREITINNLKMDMERQATETSANTSIEGNQSGSPRPRRSLESMNTSIDDKISVSQPQKKSQQMNERKNRRLSSFDQRRRNSDWATTTEKETMTDPFDTNCKCEELDLKLQECKRNLYIRESQVTALNMELKNHPLKEENAVLLKRLQEEQEMNRMEIKRYKQKIYEQTHKAEKAMAALAQAEMKTITENVTTDAALPVSAAQVTNVSTQTDCELSDALTKLQGKYTDLINICRHRYTVIQNLEQKIAQKENNDGNSMNTLESGQIESLKSQCESLKKELKMIKGKYDCAKVVLQKRREEIHRLRSQLEPS